MIKLLLTGLSLPLPVLILITLAAEEGLPGLGTLTIPILVIILLIILNGLFVIAEFAIIGVRPSQVEFMANEGNRVAQGVLAILRSPDKQNRYIATAQLGITIASLGLGMYGEPQIAHFIEPYLAWLLGLDLHASLVTTLGYLIALSILTYLHIVAGEMIPKSLALSAPDRAVFAISGPMRLMQTIFTIPVNILNWVGAILLHLFRIPPAAGQARLHSTEELELIVSESVEGGLLNQNEEEIIHNIFDFSERQVHQVMTPRPKVEAIADNTSLSKILEQVVQSKHSRFPVFRADLDHIIGVLHLKDLVSHQIRNKEKLDIRLLVRPVPVVPEHYPVEKLLTTFKLKRIHMAIVLDEFGGTAGIVTLEDLIEEVVGEVRDEFDLENEPLIERGRGILEVAGNYLLDDLASYIYLGEEEELPDVETVGGLIMTELGRVPQVGDMVTFRDQIHLTVLAVDGMAVARTRIEYPVPESDEPEVDEGT